MTFCSSGFRFRAMSNSNGTIVWPLAIKLARCSGRNESSTSQRTGICICGIFVARSESIRPIGFGNDPCSTVVLATHDRFQSSELPLASFPDHAYAPCDRLSADHSGDRLEGSVALDRRLPGSLTGETNFAKNRTWKRNYCNANRNAAYFFCGFRRN